MLRDGLLQVKPFGCKSMISIDLLRLALRDIYEMLTRTESFTSV